MDGQQTEGTVMDRDYRRGANFFPNDMMGGFAFLADKLQSVDWTNPDKTAQGLFDNVAKYDYQAVYSGFAQVFSESGQLRELLLIEVKVYDFEGQFMYEVPRMYLARPREGIHIEFPPVEEGKPNDDAEQS